ncbi:hypothetical protein HMPREF0044_1042 [Gleimia coleocanis DSM 15436]|uniref:DUF3040 domain-containing protein n=1 Tax=Gleimia coleocanis DSM 15436 TaxID=525245 RepID=C0W0G4_9ACTO|nr:DUF3040 domain-containing protein [Gleimia coleocanis]EEH64023.1 hypothetical protein HMPREF0044_1042 [Gleimia coleocanis DSM 15436]
MGLSEQERKILEQMEQEFRQDDPELASTLGLNTKPLAGKPQLRKFSAANIAIGLILLSVGLVLPIIGISIGGTVATVGFGLVGFALMFFGILYVFKPVKKPVAK